MKTPITLELIRAALNFISANLNRDQWVRVGLSIKAEFADDAGLALFDAWSQTAGESYNAKSVRSSWKSFKPTGGVTVGTLLHLAQQNGFVMPKPDQAPVKPDPEAQARRERERADARQREQASIEAGHARAADEAAAMWAQGSETGASDYLARKGVKPYGVRFGLDGGLLLPVRDEGGKLWNLQRIAPVKPADGGPDKLFLKGGRKSGLWHMLGDPANAPVLCIGEGLVTCASIHEATSRPVAVGLDASNLRHVASALRKLHPDALLLIAGDDDAQTFAKTGRNPGREAATRAARSVHGPAVFPAPLPEGASDFNDLHQASGLDAVRELIESAILAHQTRQNAPQAAQSRKPGKDGRDAPRGAGGAQESATFDRFHVDGEGVWFTPPESDTGNPRKVCGPLRVVGLARDANDHQAALLLEFDTRFSSGRRWLMPLAMLAGDGAAYRAALLGQGFMTPTDAKRRGWLTEYLQSRTPADLVRHVPRVGWHGRQYVLPDETLGASATGERVMFHSEAGVEARFSQRGTLERWRDGPARLCVGNSRLTFATSVAFGGPLLAWASGTTGGGFQSTGPTSIGKTTAFLIAASVWGRGTENDPDSYVQKWRGTSNGFEYLGEQHNDCTLILDEMGQIDAVEAGLVAYMLADGAGKARAKSGGGLRQKPTWRLLFLSSGELSLEQHMAAAGKKMKGGQEVRLIPIPAEVMPNSALETFHEFKDGHELAGWVKQHTATCYGTAGRAWLDYLVDHTEGLPALLRERMAAIFALLLPGDGAAGQVKRGALRFALVAAAGELATEAGLTGWPQGEATRAAQACFRAWIASRGGAGSSEVTAILRQVKGVIEAQGEARFTWWHRGADDHNTKTLQRAGYRRMLNAEGEPIKTDSQHGVEFGDKMTPAMGEGVSTEYFVLAEVFRAEVCRGYEVATVCRLLSEHGCIVPEYRAAPEQGQVRRYDTNHRLPGIGVTRCYRITPKLFELDL